MIVFSLTIKVKRNYYKFLNMYIYKATSTLRELQIISEIN